MGLKSICSIGFLLSLLLGQTATTNEDYFEKSIFRSLKDEGGQFSSEITFKSELFTHNVTEKYNFKLNAGESTKSVVRFKNKYYNSSDTNADVCLYINHANSSEFYDYDPYHKVCFSSKFTRRTIYYFLRIMNFVLESEMDLKILGK